MLKKVRDFIKKTIKIYNSFNINIDHLKINQGIILSKFNNRSTFSQLSDYEFKVFSQWGEDGIIQFLISELDIINKNFIEFGVEDFSESNCRFLMMKDNWSGYILDGSENNIESLKKQYYFWKFNLRAKSAFIDASNVNDLLQESGFKKDLGILSIDLDGNDYFILKSINTFMPAILICEFNSLFGSKRELTVPYNPKFIRREAHSSCLYYGASLPAIISIAEKKGFTFIGTNNSSCNAFFVRNDLMTDKLCELARNFVFKESLYRESRDSANNLTYVSGDNRLDLLHGMPLLDLNTGKIETISKNFKL